MSYAHLTDPNMAKFYKLMINEVCFCYIRTLFYYSRIDSLK